MTSEGGVESSEGGVESRMRQDDGGPNPQVVTVGAVAVGCLYAELFALV